MPDEVAYAFASIGYPLPTVKFLGDNAPLAPEIWAYEKAASAFECVETPVPFSPFGDLTLPAGWMGAKQTPALRPRLWTNVHHIW